MMNIENIRQIIFPNYLNEIKKSIINNSDKKLLEKIINENLLCNDDFYKFEIQKNNCEYKTPNSKYFRKEINEFYINRNTNIHFIAEYKICRNSDNGDIIFFQIINMKDPIIYSDVIEKGFVPLCQIGLDTENNIFLKYTPDQLNYKNDNHKPKSDKIIISKYINSFMLEITNKNDQLIVKINNNEINKKIYYCPEKRCITYGNYLNIENFNNDYSIFIKPIISEYTDNFINGKHKLIELNKIKNEIYENSDILHYVSKFNNIKYRRQYINEGLKSHYGVVDTIFNFDNEIKYSKYKLAIISFKLEEGDEEYLKKLNCPIIYDRSDYWRYNFRENIEIIYNEDFVLKNAILIINSSKFLYEDSLKYNKIPFYWRMGQMMIILSTQMKKNAQYIREN